MEIKIRKAGIDDLARINEIYNYYVLHSTATYQTVPETVESRKTWFYNRHGKHPVIVAEIKGDLLGWGAISPFKERKAYEHTGEVSIYVDHEWLHRGLGKAILESLIKLAGESGLHTLMAVISADQEPSVLLHQKYDFKTVGLIREVGCKSGDWLDVVYMQHMIKKRGGDNEQENTQPGKLAGGF